MRWREWWTGELRSSPHPNVRGVPRSRVTHVLPRMGPVSGLFRDALFHFHPFRCAHNTLEWYREL